MAKRKARANGEGSVTRRKDKDGKPGLWQGMYTDFTGKRRSVYGKTQQEVLKKMKEAQSKSEKRISIDANKITFAEWMEEWLETYSKPHIRENTYSAYYYAIHNHIIPAFPNLLLKDVRIDMLQRFINEKSLVGRLDRIIGPKTGEKVIKSGGLAHGSLKCINKVIHSALKQAVDNKLIEHNPAEKVKPPTAPKKEIRILNRADRAKIETAARQWNNPLAFTIIVALYTGMRIGEILGLKIEDINFEKKELYVRRTTNKVKMPYNGCSRQVRVTNEPKTEKGKRTIPLPDFLLDMFKEYISNRNEMVKAICGYWKYDTTPEEAKAWKDEGFIFITSQGEVSGYQNIIQIFQRVLKSCDLELINFHALRHTFATRCLEIGFDIKSLSDILGHKDATMTLNIYSHALGDQKRLNMNKLNCLWAHDEEHETE